MRAVKDGPANQSYGLQVARLAGMPAAVIEAAKAQFRLLENRAASESQRGSSPQLGLPLEQTNAHPVLAVLERVEPDEVSPKEALELFYRLTELYETGR